MLAVVMWIWNPTLVREEHWCWLASQSGQTGKLQANERTCPDLARWPMPLTPVPGKQRQQIDLWWFCSI